MDVPKFYVYEWYIIETGEVFYVGKGSGNRVTSMKDRNNYFRNIRKKHECGYRIVKYFSDEEEAYRFELEYGKAFKAEGKARACYVLGNYGRMIDKSVLNKMKPTQYSKDHEPWNKGKKMDAAYRERCRQLKIGTKQSEETKQKRSIALMKHPVSQNARSRIAEARRKAIVVHDSFENKDTVYSSIQEFAEYCGVTQSALSRVLKKGTLYRNRYYLRLLNS